MLMFIYDTKLTTLPNAYVDMTQIEFETTLALYNRIPKGFFL